MKTFELYLVEWRWAYETHLHTNYYPTEELAIKWQYKVLKQNGYCYITKLTANEDYLGGCFTRTY